MRKVLMLATYYPPAGGISTFRVTKFVKYLSQSNWLPIVLTVKEECYKECNFLIDNSLLKDIPENLIIYRTGISKKSFLLKSLLNGLPTRWLLPLFTSIRSIIKKEKPQLLFATGDPFFPLLAAPLAKFITGLEYVIDLRDPWKLAVPLHPPKGLKKLITRPLNNILETIVIKNASKVIVVSEKMAQQYREAYPYRIKQDFIVIPNGYDPDDYDPIKPIRYPYFTIIYAGKFLGGSAFRNPYYFLQALKILNQRDIIVKFKFIGERDANFEKIVMDLGVADHVESLGYLPYSHTISHMKGADLLLLIGTGHETEQTGKIFDYFGCKRPILALASNKGGIADIVRQVEEVELMDNNDPNKIAETIAKFYLKKSFEPVERNNISKYFRKNLTLELTKVFEDVISKANH